MITVPDKLQLQISDALSLIAAADFPQKWESLLPVSTENCNKAYT
jgi:exportin-2 (importin alpha re-exporter)